MICQSCLEKMSSQLQDICADIRVEFGNSGGKFPEIYSNLSGNLLKNFFTLYV